MTRTLSALALAFVAAGAACSKSKNAVDTGLATDLSLAAQQSRPLDSLSAAERANALTSTRAPASTAPRTSTARTSTVRRSTSSGTVARSSAGPVASTPAPEVTVKHTQRDAAIGAAAGAIIGATTSKNKVKGGVIGAAVGGILGGVIGNNVDKTKKKP